MKSLSHVQLFATPWTVAYQALPSMGFSRQEYWSGLPFILNSLTLLFELAMNAWEEAMHTCEQEKLLKFELNLNGETRA